jgi:fatty acid desaturase
VVESGRGSGYRGRLARRLAYYCGIFGGLHLAQVILPYVLAAPLVARRILEHRPREAAEASFLKAVLRKMWQARLDTLLCGGWLALVAAANAQSLVPLTLLFFSRTVVISFQDNLYHHGLPSQERDAGHNIALPRGVSLLILNSNYHRVHHAFPSASWRRLPELADCFGLPFTTRPLEALKSQLRGPDSSDRLFTDGRGHPMPR